MLVSRARTRSKADLPSLLMVLSFTTNLIVCLFDPIEISVSKDFGVALLVCGFVFFVYVLCYLRSGFFGATEPRLGRLITKGPYSFCRHPQYLSFIIMILGIDLMFGSALGTAFTFMLSIPSLIYKARVEDRLLRRKFRDEWENYADEVGFLLPKLRKPTEKSHM